VSAGARVRIRCACPAATIAETSGVSPGAAGLAVRCGSCGATTPLRTEHLAPGGGLLGCLACGHPELFTRKDLAPAIGILVVVVAAVLAPFTMYLSLAVAALVDLALYMAVRDVVTCYLCRAEHRGFPREPRHPRFDREIDERLRYGPRAVMGRPMRAGGTADAPDPEH